MQTFNLRQKRDVPGMVSEIFNYLKIHIWNIVKAILIFAGPFYIVGSIFFGKFYGNMMSVIETDPMAVLSSMAKILPASLIMIFGYLIFLAVIVSYMKLSLTLSKNEITLGLIYNDAKQYLWKYVGANLLLFIGIMLASIILGIALTIISPVLGFLMFMVGIIYVIIASSLFPFAIGIENANVFESIGRSFKLIKNNWWRTFAYYILVSIIQSFMAGIIMMPIYIIGFYKTFSSAIMEGAIPNFDQLGAILTILLPIVTFVNLFFYAFTGVGMGINYFSLVEQKEEVGLKEQIELINPENSSSEI